MGDRTPRPNVCAVPHVPHAGCAMGAGGNQPRLAPVDGLDAGGANDYRAAQPRWELRSAPEYYAAPATQSKLSSDLYVTSATQKTYKYVCHLLGVGACSAAALVLPVGRLLRVLRRSIRLDAASSSSATRVTA